MKTKNILFRKFPYNQKGSSLKTSVIATLIVFLVLFLFQPFGLSNYSGSKLSVSLTFGITTFILTFVYCKLVIEQLYKKVKIWRIWHQALVIFFLLLVISIGNVGVFLTLFHSPMSWQLLLASFIFTFIVGGIVTAVLMTLSYQQYLRNQLQLLIVKDTMAHDGQMITFHDEAVRSDDLTIPVNDFLYAEVVKNNIIIHYQKGGKVAKYEMRMTLSSLIDSIDYDNIIQCHRSFVINVDNITSANGNSNGYKLKLGNCPDIVPVSRSFVTRLKAFIA